MPNEPSPEGVKLQTAARRPKPQCQWLLQTECQWQPCCHKTPLPGVTTRTPVWVAHISWPTWIGRTVASIWERTLISPSLWLCQVLSMRSLPAPQYLGKGIVLSLLEFFGCFQMWSLRLRSVKGACTVRFSACVGSGWTLSGLQGF